MWYRDAAISATKRRAVELDVAEKAMGTWIDPETQDLSPEAEQETDYRAFAKFRQEGIASGLIKEEPLVPAP